MAVTLARLVLQHCRLRIGKGDVRGLARALVAYLTNGLLQLILRQAGTDEELLPGAGAEGDGFPAICGGYGDVDTDLAFGIPDGPDDARNNGSNGRRVV